MNGKGLDPYGFARYQGMQKERDAVLDWLTLGAAVQKDEIAAELWLIVDDIRNERHHRGQ